MPPAFYHRTRCAIRGRVSALGSQPRRQSSRPRTAQTAPEVLAAATAGLAAFAIACASINPGGPGPERPDANTPDAPLVAGQPGAWFDAYGNLTVVGAGRRLRLVLSAPIAACGPAF